MADNISEAHSAIKLLMSTKVITIDLNASALEIAKLMKINNVRNIFITDSGKYVGVVRDIDLVLNVMEPQRDPKIITAEEIMCHQLPYIDVTAPISEIAKVMVDTKTRRVMVTEKGKVIGTITAGDLLRLVSFVSRGEMESFLDAYKIYLKNQET